MFRESLLEEKGIGDGHQTGGRLGRHTEAMGFLLAELQYMQRTYPGMQW